MLEKILVFRLFTVFIFVFGKLGYTAIILEKAYFVQFLQYVFFFYLCSFCILLLKWAWIFKISLSIDVFFVVSHHNWLSVYLTKTFSIVPQIWPDHTTLPYSMSRLPRLRPHHNPPLPPGLLCHHRPTHLLLSLPCLFHRWEIRSLRWTDEVSSASHTMKPYECWSLHTIWWWRWRMSGDCLMPAP